MIGIYINDSKYPFTDWIMEQDKTIETRNSPTLRQFIGRRVGIIRTGNGKSVLVGYANIEEERIVTDKSEYLWSQSCHCIQEWMDEYYWDGKDKYFYYLGDVERCHATVLDDILIKRHNRTYCEIEEV